MTLGNISDVISASKKEWPPVIHGKTMWRSWATEHWYWKCPGPDCKIWVHHSDMYLVAETSKKHSRLKGHYGQTSQPKE